MTGAGAWILMVLLVGPTYRSGPFGLPALAFDTRAECERARITADGTGPQPTRCVFVPRGIGR